MNKRELAQRLAKQAHTSRAQAADDVDSLVYSLLKDMKESGKRAAETPAAAAAPKPPSTAKPPAKEKK